MENISNSVKLAFIYVLFLFIFSSCGIAGYMHKEFKPTEISTIGVLNSVVNIGIVREENFIEKDSAAFAKATDNLHQNEKTLLAKKTQLINIIEDSLTIASRNDLIGIASRFNKIKSTNAQRHYLMQDYKITKAVDSLMKRQDIDYMIFNIHEGFKRTKKNYNSQGLKGLGIGLITLGLVVPLYFPYGSSIISMIVDRKRKAIVFINSNQQQIDPLNLNDTYDQFCKLYLGVFSYQQDGKCYLK